MSWPTDICKCGHKRSEHLEPGCYCSEKGFTHILKWSKFDLNPDATAHGWNPDQLTQAQVGTAEGWRLLDEDEVFECNDPVLIERWYNNEFGPGTGRFKIHSYRTRLTRAELRAARGLTVGAPADSDDELLRALNALYWHFSYDLRLLIPKMISEASPPILVELNPDGKTFRRPSQKEVKKCRCLQIGPRSGDYDSSECSIHGPAPDSCGNANQVLLCSDDDESFAPFFKDVENLSNAQLDAIIEGKLDLEGLALECRNLCYKGNMFTHILSALQQADAAARESTETRMALHWSQGESIRNNVLKNERDQARAEVERLKEIIKNAVTNVKFVKESAFTCREERDNLRAEIHGLKDERETNVANRLGLQQDVCALREKLLASEAKCEQMREALASVIHFFDTYRDGLGRLTPPFLSACREAVSTAEAKEAE